MNYEERYKEALERAEMILCNLPEGSKSIQDIETIFPELAESEDEKIRKDIMEAVENWHPYERVEDVRAYLEKQKEQKPWKVGENAYFTPEQKPVSNPNWTELTWEDINYLEDLMAKVHYEFRNGIGAESFGKEVLEKFREYKGDEYTDEKEQKPVEIVNYPSDVIEACMLRYLQSAANRKDDVEIVEDTKAFKKELLDIIKQIEKPVEWSEEDEKIMQTMIKEGDLKPSEIAWLKSLRPQPQWKPSEEQVLKDAEPAAEKGRGR